MTAAAAPIFLCAQRGRSGGEEDGAAGSEHEHVPDAKLYTTPEDMVAVARARTRSALGRRRV